MRSPRWVSVFHVTVLFFPTMIASQTQQPPPSPNTPPAQTESSSGKKPSGRHQHDFLIKGTVFTEEGLSFAGARVRIRKAGEKSFHWEGEANSRGEFAIRVVQGAHYEVVVSAKGWKEQKKTVDATGSERIEDMVFHMEREGSKPS
jgi:Carboxypeptidase regulatory-like domain